MFDELAQRIAWLKAYGADEHFLNKTWATFTIDSKNRRAVEMVSSIELGKSHGAFLHGLAGSGKTHLMKCIMNHIIDWKVELQKRGEHSPIKLFWINMSFYLDELRSEKYAIKKKAQEATILFIDDLGTSTRTDWVSDQIFQLIDWRAERELQTFATSNLKLGDLEPIYGARIISRLFSLMVPIEMVGEDRRRDKMNANFASLKQNMNLRPVSK